MSFEPPAYLPNFLPPPPAYQHSCKECQHTSHYCNIDCLATKDMAPIMNGNGIKSDQPIGSDYSLECHNLSYIRSFTSGRWYSKIFNPPITAQFLKDVNMEVHGGEIMGVVGSGGSGKTTLLNVIARRVQGTTGGSALLNRRPMTAKAFEHHCAYVSFKQALIPTLCVKETLHYQAELTLGPAMTSKEKNDRVLVIMHDLELLSHAHQKIENLSESSRRRLMIAIQLIRDPLLILIDEPTKDIDALSSYQLMYNLFQYTKRYNRMVVVTMMMPRSDIYQLFDRITILFFGETVYSGYTKQMPVYFRQIGYPCPAYENPAIYYLSLATVDRETSERYLETQEQAVKLIEIFKGQGEPFGQYRIPAEGYGYGSDPIPLSQLGRPDSIKKFTVLLRRNWATLFSRKQLLCARLFLLPLAACFITLFYYEMQPSKSLPQSKAGLLFNCIAFVSYLATALTSVSFSVHRTRYYQESWDGAYGGVSCVLAHLFSMLLFDLFSIFATAAIIFWPSNLTGSPIEYIKFAAVLWTCFQYSQLHTICWMVFVKSAYKAFALSSTITSITLILAGAFLKAYATYKIATDWITYVTYASIFRYASAALNYNQIESIGSLNCSLTEATDFQRVPLADFCRWENGSSYLREIYSESTVFPDYWSNFAACFVAVGALGLITIVLYAIPLPHVVERKFRYK